MDLGTLRLELESHSSKNIFKELVDVQGMLPRGCWESAGYCLTHLLSVHSVLDVNKKERLIGEPGARYSTMR